MSTTPRPPRPVIRPELRRDLVAMVKRRVPESDVEDIVQAALTEAFESPNAPTDPEQLRRWVFGVAKHKVVDFHRRRGRETFDLPEVSGGPAPHVEADLLRWAEKNLPEGEDAKATLDWMLREGEGEKLESIAESERLPAPRVRQRVSRLRRHLKANWQREVALLAAVGVVLGAVLLFLRKERTPEIVFDPNTAPTPPSMAAEAMRKDALERCGRGEWQPCLEGLDRAKGLDPAGDARPEVVKAREDAQKNLAPAPLPPPTASGEIEPAPPPPPTAVPTTKTTATPPVPTPTPSPKPTPTVDGSLVPKPDVKESAKTGVPTPSPSATPFPTKPVSKKNAATSDFGSGTRP